MTVDKVFKPIYVVAGKDMGLVNKTCLELIDKILDTEEKATSLVNEDGDKLEIADVLDELRTMPFLASKKVVWVRRADSFVTKYREALEKYFGNPSKTGVLILAVDTFAATTRLFKLLKPAGGELIKLTQPKGKELYDALTYYAADKYRKKLDLQAARMLVEFSGDSLGALQNEIDKLVLYVDKAPSITANEIQMLCGRNRLFGAFEVIDQMTAGNVASAVQRLRSMFEEDRAAEYTVVGAFAYHFRRMFNAKSLKDHGRNDYEIMKMLGMWGDQKAFFASLGRLSLRQIGGYLSSLAEVDYKLKTGQTKASTAIENLILQLNQRSSKFSAII